MPRNPKPAGWRKRWRAPRAARRGHPYARPPRAGGTGAEQQGEPRRELREAAAEERNAPRVDDVADLFAKLSLGDEAEPGAAPVRDAKKDRPHPHVPLAFAAAFVPAFAPALPAATMDQVAWLAARGPNGRRREDDIDFGFARTEYEEAFPDVLAAAEAESRGSEDDIGFGVARGGYEGGSLDVLVATGDSDRGSEGDMADFKLW